MKIIVAVVVTIVASLYPGAARAQVPEGSGVLNDVTACRQISDPTERLSCFDAAVGRLQQAQEGRDIVVLDREAVRRTRRSLFGLTLPRLPFFGQDREESEPDRITEIEATIVRATQAGYNRWTMVLDDESVWQTTEAMPAGGDPRGGAPIRIRAAALGSYLANVDGGRAVRVQRIR